MPSKEPKNNSEYFTFKMYDEVQKSLYSIGFGPKLKPFNQQIVSILLPISLGVISLWIFLFHDAESAGEYVEAVCVITISGGTTLSVAITNFTTKKIFLFIKAHEEYLNESKRLVLKKCMQSVKISKCV